MLPTTDLQALTLTMIGEARGEGDSGMIDVGHTVLNRTYLHSWRGSNIKDVCLMPWQYSCWNVNDPNRLFLHNIPDTDLFYKRIQLLASSIIDGSPDTTCGATYYYRIGSPEPKWAYGKDPCYVNGHHQFYKDIA